MGAMIAAMLMVSQKVIAKADEPKAKKPIGADESGNPLQVIQGRNAAKRAARARIYKGPAKTPKGMKGK